MSDVDQMVRIDNKRVKQTNMQPLLKTKPKIVLPPVNGITNVTQLARFVRDQRAEWDNDYPFRTRDYFPEDEIFKYFDDPVLKVGTGEELTPAKLNPKHTFKRFLCAVWFGAWSLKIVEHVDESVNWDIAAWNGVTWAFHPDECANQILDHHSEEVFNRWRRMARAQYEEVIGPMLEAAKECIPSFACGSITSCDSSERLMKATPGVIVKNHIAYLIW